MKDKAIAVTDELLESAKIIKESITKVHEDISRIPTPKVYVKKKNGLDYIEIGYMKNLADKYFPGWSWKIINSEALGSEAYVVHGRLKWFDNGVWRYGDMVAAHRIQKKKGTNEFVDVGNDIKASNTDTMKKAFNMYMNIGDDIYKNQVEDLELSDEKIKEILEIAKQNSKETYEKVTTLIDDQMIHNGNYKGSLAKLKRGIKNEKDK